MPKQPKIPIQMMQKPWNSTTKTKKRKSTGVLAEGSCDQPKLLEICFFWYFWYPSILYASFELIVLGFLVQFHSFTTFCQENFQKHMVFLILCIRKHTFVNSSSKINTNSLICSRAWLAAWAGLGWAA